MNIVASAPLPIPFTVRVTASRATDLADGTTTIDNDASIAPTLIMVRSPQRAAARPATREATAPVPKLIIVMRPSTADEAPIRSA